MNKDFESEYREYQKMSVPDLWDRIEAGIDALEEDKAEPKKIIKFPVRKMATIAAACFAVIICIPALGILIQVFGGSKSEDSVTTNETAAVEYESACEEEYFAADSIFDSEPSEAPAATEMSGVTSSQGEASEESVMAEMNDGAMGSEEFVLTVTIQVMEVLEDERRYLATNVETQESITIIQDVEFEPMEEDAEYTISVIKADEEVYYFVDMMVE